MMSKKRKYDDSYIKWGFMKFVEKDETERPQCVLCYKVLAEASIKLSKLKAHSSSIHPTHENDSEIYVPKQERLLYGEKYFDSTRIPIVDEAYH